MVAKTKIKKSVKKTTKKTVKNDTKWIGKKFNIRVENIVACADFKVKIPLEKVVSKMDGMEYEPEQFPGLVYRMKVPKVAFLLFGSGKIVITGGRTVTDVETAVLKVSKKLKSIGAMVPEN